MSNFEHPGGYKSLNDEPEIVKFLNGKVPYTSVAQANSLILFGQRSIGLTVNINFIEFHYKETRADEGLVLKIPDISSKADLINGVVPSNQLPSYVDDIIEGYLNSGVFYKEVAYTNVIAAEKGKIYIDITDGQKNREYRYSGTVFIKITNGLIASTADVTEDTGFKYFTTARVLATVLSGFSALTGTVTSADTILSAFGKLQKQINDIITTLSSKANTADLSQNLRFQTVWNTGNSQTFTLPNTFYQIQEVIVQGISLKNTQYTTVGNTQVTINDTLENGEYVIILYGTNASSNSAPYYTQAQVDFIAATKANTTDLSQILRYETTWVSGSQTFTLPNTYYNIQSVVVQGISLKSTQYTLASSTEVTINDTLSSNDYVVIIYGTNASANNAAYYTQAQVDAKDALKVDIKYKVYTALLTQLGTSAPSVVSFGNSPLENTLGGAVTFSYDSIGVFYLNLAGAFPIVTKVTAIISHSNSAASFGFASAVCENNDRIKITTKNSSGALINGSIAFAKIEVTVYN